MKDPKTNVIILPGIHSISEAAADRLSEVAAEAVYNRGLFHLVLSGGKTPETLYKILTQSPYNSSIPWDLTHIFWGDERCVPPENKESNFGEAQRVFLSSLPVREHNIHRIKGELGAQKAQDDYRQLLERQSDQGRGWPQFDLVLLGMGADGHTASLFPGQISVDERQNSVISVTAHYEGRPSSRITMTPLAINSARNIIFLVTGSNKAAAFAAAINGPEDQEKWPVQRIRPSQGSVIWLVDEDAGADL